MVAVCSLALRENKAMAHEALRKLEEREKWLGVASVTGDAIRTAIAMRGVT